jgi:hypothetical protein
MKNDYEHTISTLIAERDELKQHCFRLQKSLDSLGYPPGHFYSPVVDAADRHVIRAVRERLKSPLPAGIHLNHGAMKSMLERLAAHHCRFQFPRNAEPGYRFYFDNPFFACHDASVLFSMLLEFRSRRVVEIGCGFSTRLLLDTNEQCFGSGLELTLIDPALDALVESGALGETGPANLLSCALQDAPAGTFDGLEAGDILFLDSSHVSKTGSDVNYYLFEILPRLKPGVLIHIHDILFPFEYLEDWVLQDKRSWNEAYVMRAFLQYNDAFEILYWNNYIYHRLSDDLKELMPLCLENEGGSLWLRKTG